VLADSNQPARSHRTVELLVRYVRGHWNRTGDISAALLRVPSRSARAPCPRPRPPRTQRLRPDYPDSTFWNHGTLVPKGSARGKQAHATIRSSRHAMASVVAESAPFLLVDSVVEARRNLPIPLERSPTLDLILGTAQEASALARRIQGCVGRRAPIDASGLRPGTRLDD